MMGMDSLLNLVIAMIVTPMFILGQLNCREITLMRIAMAFIVVIQLQYG